MLPELIEIGPLVIRSYGLVLAAGCTIGAWWFAKRAAGRSIEISRAIDMAIVVLVAGLLGARMLYVFTHWHEFSGQLWRIIWPIESDGHIGMHGFVFYGGILGAVPAAALMARRWKLSPLKLLNAAAPPLALGSAIGRMGCFLNGCCYGVPAEGAPGLIFPQGSLAGATFPEIPIHPVQLYMVADNLLITLLLLSIERRWARFDGLVIGAYFVLTGLMRGYEDFLRYYESSMKLFSIAGVSVTVNHLIGVVLTAGGVLLIARSLARQPE